jgi:hypothetical protein
MTTAADTARLNGAKSNGPITPEGKATSAQNSLKHGLTSSRVVLAHESQEEYDALESDFLQRFNPEGALEADLVHEMAASRWRLRRIESMETALFKKALREQTELLGPNADLADVRDAAYLEVAESKAMRTITRHGAQLRRAYEKAWKEFKILENERKNPELQNEPSARLTMEMLDIMTDPSTPATASSAMLREVLQSHGLPRQ